MAMAASEGISEARCEQTSTRPKIGRLTLRQPTFDWHSTGKYAEPRNFRLEVHISILQC